MRLDGKADVFEEVDDFFRVAKISRLAVAKQQEPIEHVKDLRRGLVNSQDDRFVFLTRVILQRRHQTVRRTRVQSGSRLLSIPK